MPMERWAFLSTHALVWLCIAREPTARLRDIAAAVGITERAAGRLLGDLVAAGYVVRARQGRRNAYPVALDRPLRHPLECHATAGALLAPPRHHPARRPTARPTAGGGRVIPDLSVLDCPTDRRPRPA